MEYEFRRNPITGLPFASFSMEHEVFGRWFSEELADDKALCLKLENAIDALLNGSIQEWRWVGRDLTLEMEREQVRIFANVLGYDGSTELEEEGLSLYDAESMADCGLEDFQSVLHSWCSYLAGN
ncbi:YacL family protein [Shewanella yunxiaonensis]|uniref:YacL family protein n=1 Tax=Shewanella yunxiaonensis TaxID=2829809 RepID=A0ABX7YWL9_9GAMM|nr:MULTISPECIES: YacL family protein [Shewanella]MDF0533220.1 YacL family protein [Shewanella sp. A32]QUN06561.1 YacL family protein [Shewanella yunxiaonensis]